MLFVIQMIAGTIVKIHMSFLQKNDYENNIYYNGMDIYGQKRSLGCNEFPDVIYSKTDYEIDWR